MANLELGPAEIDTAATASLRRVKPKARSQGDLNGAVLSAMYYAKKLNQTVFGFEGNSYGHGVWRISTKPSEYLNGISNTGARVFSVSPDMIFSWHDVTRKSTKAKLLR